MAHRVIHFLCGVVTAWLFCSWPSSAALEVAGELLVDLDAKDFKAGMEKWPQRSSATEIQGDFLAKGSPTRQVVAGAPAVVFDGDGDYFIGPVTTAALHAPGARHSVEVWVFQGNVRDQESIVSWSRRWGPNHTFAGFRYGADPDFGAIARWSSSESGFENLPPPGQWHYLAYTYDGSMQAVYVNGELDNSKPVGLLDAHDMLPIHLGAEIGGDLKIEGQFTHFSGALARVRIHSGTLGADQVKQNFRAERSGFPGPAAKPLRKSPMHRFSFNDPSGPAPDGTPLADSIGGLTGVIRGANAVFSGGAVALPGGSGATEAYIDLPNGLISSRESLTIEFWATQSVARDWCRILSIGTNNAGEITGPGGNFSGSETLTLFGNVGATQVTRFARSEGSFPNGGPDRDPADYPDSDFGVEFHQVITYDKDLQEWQWHRNGVLMEVIPDREGPTTIDDVNVWLGRSEFSSDQNFQGLYNEFRIYNHTLSEDEIYGNFLAGPDKLNLGADVIALNWIQREQGSHSFVNRAGSDHWNTGPGGPHPDGKGSIATFANALLGDQQIVISSPVTLGSLNLGSHSRGGSFRIRGVRDGRISMDSGNNATASITQLPGSTENCVEVPVFLESDTEFINQSPSPLVMAGSIQGDGAFIKSGIGPVVLTSDGASHAGPVKIVSGSLILRDSGSAGMLTGTPFTISSPGQLVLDRHDDIELNGEFGGTGKITHSGIGKLTLGAGGSITGSGILQLPAGPFSSFGRIDGPAAVMADTQVELLGRSITRLTDIFSVGVDQGGLLKISDVAALSVEGRGHLNIGDIGTGQSAMFMTGGTVSCRELFIGKSEQTSGVLIQNAGRIHKIKTGPLLDTRVGGATDEDHQVWGAWHMTGGEFIDEWNLQIGAFGAGVMEVDGGTVSVEGFLGIGRYEDDHKHPSHGLLDVKSGSVTVTGQNHLLLVGEEGVGVLNIRGTGRVTCVNRMIIGAGTIDKPGEGTVNLLPGGTLVTTGISQFNQTEAMGRLNLDGGTLRASRSDDGLIEGIDFAYVRKGGAMVDSNGFDVRINQPLLAPGGDGVVSIPVVHPGTGYLGAPFIDITGGGGSGATAVANLVDGSIRSITVTHPGNDYLSPPAVTVRGGGNGTGLMLGSPVLAPNTSGGLTKTGSGILTLGRDNSYTGPTTVKQGGLRIAGVLTSAVKVASGATLHGNGSIDASLEMAPGSKISPDPGGIIAVRDDANLRGTFLIALDGTGTGRIDVGGKLDLTGAKLAIDGGDKPGGPVHLIASYGTLLGKFAENGPLPAGYRIHYRYQGTNRIALVSTAASSDGE